MQSTMAFARWLLATLSIATLMAGMSTAAAFAVFRYQLSADIQAAAFLIPVLAAIFGIAFQRHAWLHVVSGVAGVGYLAVLIHCGNEIEASAQRTGLDQLGVVIFAVGAVGVIGIGGFCFLVAAMANGFYLFARSAYRWYRSNSESRPKPYPF